MLFNLFKSTLLLCVFVLGCNGKTLQPKSVSIQKPNSATNPPIVGANQTEVYLPLLRNKSIAVVANPTSVIFKSNNTHTHLVDSLVAMGVNLTKVFSPEHGFRGTADAGEVVKDGIDTKTNLPIISLYGNSKKPSKTQLEGIDLMVFDLQDVGVRFYTYISTLHYIMEACAEANIPVLVLDRPNPNGHYTDGPILEPQHKSFVGLHPVPVVHGMTIGEYAQMINGEGWLANNAQCELKIIAVKHYTHQTFYNLPIKPSPNLPNATAINLYPSLCFFEGTNVSAGRGTDLQFQQFGSPFLNPEIFKDTFTPKPNEGAKHPKHNGRLCFGTNLANSKPLTTLDLSYLIQAYKATQDKSDFFIPFFTNLAGTTTLQKQIELGLSTAEIKTTWELPLKAYNSMRQPYMLYD